MAQVPSISEPLTVYLGNDGNVYAVNPADGRSYATGTGGGGTSGGGGGTGGGGIADAPADGNIYGRQNNAWAQVPSGGGTPANQAQISVYDDFINCNQWTTTQTIGSYPGGWVINGNAAGTVLPTNAQNGVIAIPNSTILQQNIFKSATAWPVPFFNIAKIVSRFVFAWTNVAYPAGQESPVGFTHTATIAPDTSNNLYGALINFCPGFPGLPDWDTRANLTPTQTAAFTYGVYNGQASAGFGYKQGTIISSVTANTWYEGIISLTPGVSCSFYIALYGSTPVLDKVCAITSLITNQAGAGPVVIMANSTTAPGNLLVDKCQYAIWVTEGNKALTDNQLHGF